MRNERNARRFSIGSVVLALALVGTACGPSAHDGSSVGPRTLLGPTSFPCGPEHGEGGYARYGVGPMRRGGWQREELEPDHIVIDGQGVNLHGTAHVVDGGTIELEMDEDYFAPTVLKGPPGATVTVELHNDGTRGHSFFVPGQGIDLHCGVRAEDAVQVVFPRSGVLVYRCRYSATSGMRGAFRVQG